MSSRDSAAYGRLIYHHHRGRPSGEVIERDESDGSWYVAVLEKVRACDGVTTV